MPTHNITNSSVGGSHLPHVAVTELLALLVKPRGKKMARKFRTGGATSATALDRTQEIQI